MGKKFIFWSILCYSLAFNSSAAINLSIEKKLKIMSCVTGIVVGLIYSTYLFTTENLDELQSNSTQNTQKMKITMGRRLQLAAFITPILGWYLLQPQMRKMCQQYPGQKIPNMSVSPYLFGYFIGAFLTAQ